MLNLVGGGAAVGEAIVSHPEVDAVTFTGSTRVGRSIAAALASRGVPFQGELGGKNAALVLADADMEVAVEQVMIGAFRSAGQKCTATSRVIVHADVADEFLERLAGRIQQMIVGDAQGDGIEVGPVIDARSQSRLMAAIERAQRQGRPGALAQLPASCASSGGYFVPPAVFEVDADDPGELWTDELFGPIIAVRRVQTTAAGIELVNDSEYGLSTAVFTRGIGAALEAVEDIRAGVVHINSASAGADLHVPFGGVKASAFGPKEQGGAARDFFTETATVYMKG